MFRTLSPGDGISVALRKLLQGGRRGSQVIYKFATKGAGSLNFKDQVSRNLAFSFLEDASLWAHWIHSFHLHHLFPCSPCFLHSPSSSAITLGGGSVHWSQFWELSFTFGGQKSLMAVTFLVYWYGRRYFHFTMPWFQKLSADERKSSVVWTESKGLIHLESFPFASLRRGWRALFTGPPLAVHSLWEPSPPNCLVLALNLCSSGPA